MRARLDPPGVGFRSASRKCVRLYWRKFWLRLGRLLVDCIIRSNENFVITEKLSFSYCDSALKFIPVNGY